jgi:hypothetical protein
MPFYSGSSVEGFCEKDVRGNYRIIQNVISFELYPSLDISQVPKPSCLSTVGGIYKMFPYKTLSKQSDKCVRRVGYLLEMEILV